MKSFAIGIDLGGTQIKAGLVERDNGLIATETIDTEAAGGPKGVLDRIATVAKKLGGDIDNLAGIGIGSPGSINWNRTHVSYPPNLPGWEVIDVQSEIQDRWGSAIPVLVENDANAAGLGSAYYGAGLPFDSFIMITLGTGVGGAIIYRKKIFRGTTGGAAEIGHMSIDFAGPPARSGIHGAIEAYLGQRFLSQYARFRLLPTTSIIHQMAGPDLTGITPKMLFEAAEQGDQEATDILAWAGDKLGVVLGSAINLLDIRKVVVGGGLSAAGDYILGPTRHSVRKYVLQGLQDGIEIVQETLGNEAGVLGPAHLLFQHQDGLLDAD